MVWRQFGATFLRYAARERIPVTHVVSLLRREGIAFRYSEMLETYRTYLSAEERAIRFKYIPKKYRIPRTLIHKAPFAIGDNYRYQTSWLMRDKTTGEEWLYNRNMTHPEHLSPSRVYSELEKTVMDDAIKYKSEVIAMDIHSVWQR